MKIRKINENDIPLLIQFGEEVFPDRKSYYGSLVEFFLKNRIDDSTGGMVIDNEGEILGQVFFTKTDFWYQGKKTPSCWGYDLIVREDLRKEAWGIDLMIEARRNFKNSCATGSGPNALKLNLKLGSIFVGEIRKYVGVSSHFRTLMNLILPTYRVYPENVGKFHLVRDPHTYKERDFFNFELLETNRDSEFIKWRFFSKGFYKYALYQNSSGEYFVVRIIKYMGFSMMGLMDYRCNLNTGTAFSEILSCVKILANRMRVPFILCGSTHRQIDELLEKNLFKSIGRPRPIIMGKQFKSMINTEKVNSREFTLITLSDSDGEVSWE